MVFKKSSLIAISAVVLAASAGSGFAQTSKGILVGVARDQSGAVVINATITVTNQDTNETRTVRTKPDGAYRIEAITPGKYTIVVSQPGFDTAQLKGVVVAASAVTSYDISLKIGQQSTEVEVEANQATINTDNGTLTGMVSAKEIDKLPIFSLNPVELATTVPGVQTVSNDNGFSNGINIQVNGSRPRDNNYLLDGQEINDVGIAGQAFQPQIPDVFDSVSVITNSASAEYGRGSGGIVNMITQHGTNTFHGELFERYTGSGLNAVPGGYRGSDFVKTRYDQHSYGFTAGGPIIRNKLFAFGAWELQRYYGQETPGVNLLPDQAGYQTLQSISGPAAAQVATFDNYVSNGAYLTQDLMYPGATGAITKNVGALPGCPAGGCVVSFAGFQRPNQAEVSPDTQWMYRVDYTPWEKDSLSFRYLHDRTSLTPDFFNNPNALAGFDTEQGGPTELAEGQWTHILSPTLLNEFRVSEARLAFTFAPTTQTAANPLNDLPTLTFSSLSGTTTAGTASGPSLGPNQNFPQGREEDLYQFQDTIGYTKGRQSFRFGADIGRLIEIDLVSQNAVGTLTFAGGGSGVTSFGNFLLNQLGPGGTATKVFGSTRVDSHGYRNGFFAQDDIKLNTDLTLNLGIRYDYLSNPENSLKYPGVDPTNVFAPINTVVPIQNDYNNFAPRIGFAYAPHTGGFFGDGKTVIRGGFGVFYDSTFSNILVNSSQASPAAIAATLIQSTGNGLANASGLISTINPVLSPLSTVESEDSHLVNPLTYQYNLGVERQLPGQNVLGIRYVGNRGEKEFANQQYNYFDGTTGNRLNTTRGAIILRGNYADSDYNSVLVDFTHNFNHGLLIRANYAYGKDLDDGSEIFTLSTSPTSYSANLAPGGRGQDWGNSAYDHRQFFSLAYVYQPKGLHSDNKLADAAYGVFTRHWTISGVSQLQSGAYQTFNTSGVDTNGDGSTTNDRPLLTNRAISPQMVGVDGHFLGGTTGAYYDMAQYNSTGDLVTVTPDQVHFLVPYGPANQYLHQEIGRNSYQLPGTTTHNLALEKGVGLSYLHFERGTLLLRAEAQNVFNHNDSTVGDTDVLDAGPNGFLTPSRASANVNQSLSNRNLILWAKIQF
jgi:outer membrane receptor protein involved in Fe transport